VLNVQLLQGINLKPMHLLGIFFGVVIVTKEVERAVDDEMGKVVGNGFALRGRLAAQHPGGKNDVAERADRIRRQSRNAAGREGQHIGRARLSR
jgi:hypothetical protein